ncbi:hypothetical protein GDO78_018759 [Eleutherodactylus coqui]|uniref:Uncharacterized protein n=1 Tax=Eleutherodactylus coqui TaxID=57060 RepID=A0A8J6EIV2_ELECQ|nr:hypothetical protein GDO78_018759 [Eleutherodactylus coqui]
MARSCRHQGLLSAAWGLPPGDCRRDRAALRRGVSPPGPSLIFPPCYWWISRPSRGRLGSHAANDGTSLSSCWFSALAAALPLIPPMADSGWNEPPVICRYKQPRSRGGAIRSLTPESACLIRCLFLIILYVFQEVHDSEIHAVKFSPNSKMVATGGADRVVKIWDVVGGQLQCQQVLHGCNGGITSIDFDSSGAQLLAASFDGSAHLWKLGSKSSDTLTGHMGKVTAARFKMSPYRAVTSSMDRTIKEWDLHKAACIRSIAVPSYCSDVVCSDSYMISGHHDKKIRFWDSRSRVLIREVTLEEKVTSLFMEPEQRQLLSCSRDDVLRLIDLRMGSVLLTFRADGFKCGCDWNKAILSPDATYSMSGSSDGTIFIWNTQTGLLERSLSGEHSAAVNAVAWSVSGEYVVSVDRGRKAVLWCEY